MENEIKDSTPGEGLTFAQLDAMPAETLRETARQHFGLSMSWQYDRQTGRYAGDPGDPDGFPAFSGTTKDIPLDYLGVQRECWRQFNNSPVVGTAVRGVVGRIVGKGFRTTSPNARIQEHVDAIQYDWRSQLYDNWHRWLTRYMVEGELFLLFTVRPGGNVEITFIDPACVEGPEDGRGVIYHQGNTSLPVVYTIRPSGDDKTIATERAVPSVWVAEDPRLLQGISDVKGFNPKLLDGARSSNKRYNNLGGFFQFVCQLSRGYCTRRAISSIYSTLKWVNRYELLKELEIDTKRSASSYLWSVELSPVMSRLWEALSDEDRAKTGIMAKKTPGSIWVLPNGATAKPLFPNISNISNQDEDILAMIASGLNEPEDVATGRSRGTYASIKASRGPASDRISDEIAYFDRWYRFTFWRSIFTLKSKVSGFPQRFDVRECVGFAEDKTPIFATLRKRPEHLLEVDYPTSETIDYESRAKGLLGSKHGSMAQSLGISHRLVAEKMGVGSYGRARLEKATEDAVYPELVYNDEASHKAADTQE